MTATASPELARALDESAAVITRLDALTQARAKVSPFPRDRLDHPDNPTRHPSAIRPWGTGCAEYPQ